MYMDGAYEGQKMASEPGTRVTNRCEPAHGCWELNRDPPAGQQVLSGTEPQVRILK